MKKYQWKLENIDCASCAYSITKYLEKEKADKVNVNIMNKTVSFNAEETQEPDLKKGLSNLGYPIKEQTETHTSHTHTHEEHSADYTLIISILLTLPLLSHMFIHNEWLMNPYVQLVLTLPVYFLGLGKFGKSAWFSLLHKTPNMNVLIILGATSAFIYSLVGVFYFHDPKYYFFETTAAIFTLVMLGNWLEHIAIKHTQKTLRQLLKKEKLMANMIAFDSQYQEQIFSVESNTLQVGDLILVKTGEKIPADAKIIWGEGNADESILTGESTPIFKQIKDTVLGGSLLIEGTIKAQVNAVGKNSVIGNITHFIQQAENEKPPIQHIADKISSIFIPTVIILTLFGFLLNYFIGAQSFTESLMRAVAMLVIACPCALGLATPAAMAVGLGMAYKKGILFRKTSNMEILKNIKRIAFDKTGTLTTGQLQIEDYRHNENEINETDFKNIVTTLEKFSNHPIAVSIMKEWTNTASAITFHNVEEIKGTGIKAQDKEGNIYQIGSYKIVAHIPDIDKTKSVYLTKNNHYLGWINLSDTIRKEAYGIIEYFRKKQIEIYLISGDLQHKCAYVAKELGIENVYSEQSPEDKMHLIQCLNREKPLAMVGDGINDAPALARADIGISMSSAAQIAMQSADIVLINQSLENLPFTLGIGRETVRTIKHNFLWGLSYNVFALPVAALGLLHPIYAAFIMGFSDVILALNSLYLLVKKIK